LINTRLTGKTNITYTRNTGRLHIYPINTEGFSHIESFQVLPGNNSYAHIGKHIHILVFYNQIFSNLGLLINITLLLEDAI